MKVTSSCTTPSESTAEVSSRPIEPDPEPRVENRSDSRTPEPSTPGTKPRRLMPTVTLPF